MSIDTACSSSLVATHALALELQQVASASWEGIAAGVNLTLSQLKTAAFDLTGMLAPDGRCKTLDEKADGYVRAEACVLFRIQCEDRHSGDLLDSPILLLTGSAVNQDGRSSGLTAPSGPAQTAVMQAALLSIHASSLSSLNMVELHGTGTPLGDPIEIGGIAAALRSSGRAPVLHLSAAKAFTGHAETAAGTIGMLHASIQLQNSRQSSLSDNFRNVNSLVSASLVPPMRPPRQPGPGSLSKLAAGVSAFAFQVCMY